LAEPMVFAEEPVELQYCIPGGEKRTVILAPLALKDLSKFIKFKDAHPEADGMDLMIELLRLSADWLQPGITADEVSEIPCAIISLPSFLVRTMRSLGMEVPGGGPGNAGAADMAATD